MDKKHKSESRGGAGYMTVAIRYFSQTGNTQRLALALGEALGVRAEDVSVPLTAPADVLFLGSSVYAGSVDAQVKRFIADIAVPVGRVVNFSTAALLPSTYAQVRRLVRQKGLVMDARAFACRGAFGRLHKGRPNDEDCAALSAFGKSVITP